MSRVHLCGRPWGAMPNPENRLRVKPATGKEKLRGNPLQTSVGTQGNPRRTVKTNFGKGKYRTCRKHTGTPAGNPQETRRKPAGSLQETCRKPREDLEGSRKAAKLKPKGNPPKTLGRKRAKETCTRLRQTCSKAVETRRKHALWQTWKPRGIEPRSLDSESRALTVTPRDQLPLSRNRAPWPCADCPTPSHALPPAGQRNCKHSAAIDVEDTEQRSQGGSNSRP